MLQRGREYHSSSNTVPAIYTSYGEQSVHSCCLLVYLYVCLLLPCVIERTSSVNLQLLLLLLLLHLMMVMVVVPYASYNYPEKEKLLSYLINY